MLASPWGILAFLLLPYLTSASPARDSLLHWLETDQQKAWEYACKTRLEIRNELNLMGLQDFTAPDNQEWKWLRYAHSQLSRDFTVVPRMPLDPEQVRVQEQWKKSRPWVWALGLMTLWGVGLWMGLRRSQAKLTKAMEELRVWPEATPFMPWIAGGLRPKVSFDAMAWNRIIQVAEPTPLSPRWQLLNASERDCAEMLHEGLRVEEIAQRLAVSNSYVYNLRFSIRRKWNLSESDDLLQAIRTELTAAPPATNR